MKKRIKIALITALGGCLALSLGLFAACGMSCGEGNHVYENWTAVTAATCTAGGTEKATCTVCGEETTRNVDALGHDWKVIKDESTPATCMEDGVEKRGCSRCDVSETNTLEAQGHVPGDTIVRLVKSANCTQDGEKIVKCDVCQNEVSVVIPALNHNWLVDTVVQEATCTEAGRQLAHCSRGDAKDTEIELPALGHDWEMIYTIDVPASFEGTGSKSRHCTRCEEKTSVTTISQLKEDEPMQYNFRLARTNGDLITIAGVKAKIFDEGGNPLDGTVNFSKGKASAALLPQNYTVRVDETTLPEGYAAAEASFSVGWANPTCTVTLRGSIVSGAPASNARYVKGSAMHDFSYTTLATGKRPTSETITLSGLLQEYKIVVLNFWYINCQFCQFEFPGMQAAYETYKNDVAIIAIDPNDAVAENIRNSANGYGLSFYVTMDTAGLADRFSVSAFPTTVVIDREGIVGEIHASALVNPLDYRDREYCTRQFERLFNKYTTPPYYQDVLSTAAYIVPEKRKI